MQGKVSTELVCGPNLVQIKKSLEPLGIGTPFLYGADRRKRFKEVLKLPEQEKVEFNAHSDSERAGGSSRAKTKMMV